VLTVDDLEPLKGQEPEPEKERHRIRLTSVLTQPVERLHACLLEDVRRIDSPPEPPVEAELDHPMQSVMVSLEQRTPQLTIARGDPAYGVQLFAGSWHGGHHNL
jgi:hypothetical protein